MNKFSDSHKKLSFQERFIYYEEKHELYKLVDPAGFHYWSWLRIRVYDSISGMSQYSCNFTNGWQKIKRLCYFLKRFVCTSFQPWHTPFSSVKADYFISFFGRPSSRVNHISDIYINDIVQQLKKQRCVFADLTPMDAMIFHFFRSFYPIGKFFISRDLLNELKGISCSFSHEWPETPLPTQFFYAAYLTANLGHRILKFWFKKHKIKKFIISNCGFPYAYSAARECGVSTIEYLHGCTEGKHAIWNMSSEYGEKYYLLHPDYFFVFGKYWVDVFSYSGAKIIPVGNSVFSERVIHLETGFGKIAVAGDLYTRDFLYQVLENSDILENYEIFFKLHPADCVNIELYHQKFSLYNNVHIITDEYNFRQLLQFCGTVLLTLSTVMYESWHNQRKVIQLECPEHVSSILCGMPNCYYVNDITTFRKALNEPFKTEATSLVLFEEYHKDLAWKYLCTDTEIS